MAAAKGKVYEHSIADGLVVAGDRMAIGQTFSILLDNALKYSPKGGHISLKAQRRGKRVEIMVSNTVDSTNVIDISRLFERFYRADESHSSTVSGTGIGLSVAQAIVQAHGGNVTANIVENTIFFTVII